jgi:dihydrofolate reductase
MIITLIAALDEDGAIGRREGGLPWRLPAESAHFRSYCRGRWMLLGRKTFDEMHGWFSDETVLVLTHSPSSVSAPGHAVRSVEEAIELAATAGAAELVVAGGAEVFALALPYATRLVLTRVHLRSGGTVLFPPINEMDWRVIDERFHPADAENSAAFAIRTLVRA